MKQTVATILGTTIAVGTVSSLYWWYYFTRSKNATSGSSSNNNDDDEDEDRNNNNNSTSSLSSAFVALQPSFSTDNFRYSQQFKPPFPPKIRTMLSKCRLAYLSTVDSSSRSSHLSLMRFTYVCDPTDGEVVVMSTNVKTKKFDMLAQQSGVALLVHDFVKMPEEEEDGDGDGAAAAAGGGGGGGTYSMTLNGQCRILENGTAQAEKYRQAHLQHNPEYPQFIVGPDIVMLCIDVTSARICDIRDQVTKWNVKDGISSSS